MFGIDFHIHSFCIPFKKQSVSLVKIDYDDFQSVYSKIPASLFKSKEKLRSLKSINSQENTVSCDIGIFNLFTEESKAEENSKPHSLSVSLYSDQNELELICAGKLEIQSFFPIDNQHPFYKNDSLMNCCNFIYLKHISSSQSCNAVNLITNDSIPSVTSGAAEDHHHRITIPLYYKTQGKYTIDGASLTMSIKIYSIDVKRLQTQYFLSDNTDNTHCPRCYGEKLEFQFPEFSIHEEIENNNDNNNNVSFATQTTTEEKPEEESEEEEEEYFEDDYDSVDEFIDQFNHRLTSPQPVEVKEESVLMSPPLPQRKKTPVLKKKKKKSISPERRRKERDFVQENAMFPKALLPSRSKFVRYLRFK
jgi:hypothetical protein